MTFVTTSPAALAVIAGTHVLIDRYRLARYLVWFRNQFAPKAARYRIEEGLVKRVCNCLLGQQAPTIYPRSETGRILTVGCPVHDPERRKA